jgi:hypothetical protein
MNVVDQALSVVAQAEEAGGRVSLQLELDLPGHRAALAAALAVLRALGQDAAALVVSDESPDAAPPRSVADEPGDRSPEAVATASGADEDDASGEDFPGDAPLRDAFAQEVAELTPDAERQGQVVRECFPRVRDLLRDGANVASVAQIQYRRWVEENLDAVRRN